MKKYLALLLALLVSVLSGCGSEDQYALKLKETDGGQTLVLEDKTEVNVPADAYAEKDPIAVLKMENGGVIVLRLYPSVAPNTVANFVTLANSGFYDGLIFHRVISGFMIQGGDPEGNGTGGPGYKIAGEFTANGFKNELSHKRGVISMARATPYDSAGSQFFIVHQDSPHLDGQYAAFGEVTDGMQTVDRIASVVTNSQNKPLNEQKIKYIRVETFGREYTLNKIGE
ncbi:MAG: peptidylprolyl isomerase [Clostridia bacterium]|nr:peptidylprolyl isomerase [Clostridia bacterium]